MGLFAVVDIRGIERPEKKPKPPKEPKVKKQALAEMGGRVLACEKSIDLFQGFCEDVHTKHNKLVDRVEKLDKRTASAHCIDCKGMSYEKVTALIDHMITDAMEI